MLIYVYICVNFVKRGVLTIISENSAVEMTTVIRPTINTVCLPSNSIPSINTTYIPSTEYAFNQQCIPTINIAYLISTEHTYHQYSIVSMNTTYLPSTQYTLDDYNTVYLPSTRYIPTINTMYNIHNVCKIL